MYGTPSANEFPNSLARQYGIKEALSYGAKVTGGYWMLKPEIRLAVTAHSEMIAYYQRSARRGYDIWIGQREQRDEFSTGHWHRPPTMA